MCVLPFAYLTFESLHICISFETPTEVRKFKRSHGEGLSKEKQCHSDIKAKRGMKNGTSSVTWGAAELGKSEASGRVK